MSFPSPSKVQSTQKPGYIAAMWVFAAIWCGISFTLFGAAITGGGGFLGGAIGGLFSLIGLGLLYQAASTTLEYLKYGRVHLVLEAEPPKAGQRFSATIVLPAGTIVTGTVSAELACVQVTWRRAVKGAPSRGESDYWVRKQLFGVRRRLDGDHVTLQLEVPADQPASDLPGEEDNSFVADMGGRTMGVEVGTSYYRWELRVKADVPGVDFDRTFRLRVAPGEGGAGARPGIAPAAALRPAAALAPDLERRIDERRKAERKLSLWCAFLVVAPILAGFVFSGIAIGLATGCLMGGKTVWPQGCEFVDFDGDGFMAKGFDAMFLAAPIGIGASALLYFTGRLWLDRRYQTSSFGGPVGLIAGLAVLGVILYQMWQFARPFEAPVIPPQAQQAPAKREAAAPARPSGGAAASWQEDEARLKQSLAAVEQDGGPDSPAAQAQYQLSLAYGRQNKIAEQEQALLAALAILEKYPPAEARQALGAEGASIDKEVVARRLGDFYWDRRRYDQAYVHYDKAYRYVTEIQLPEAERNRRLARNSAGRMVGACTQGDWAVADQAMQELKERIVHVDAETRKQLEYWIRTGEPRLAARKC